MDPNNLPSPTPNPQAPPPGQFDASQFDFIMNPGQPQKKSLIPLPGGSKAKMIVLGLGITTIVIILLVVIMSIFSSSDPAVESLVKITQQQNEIIRIADDGNRKAGNEDAKKLATMSYMTITTDQKEIVGYLAKQKRKVKDKELSLLTDKKTDSDLAAASSNGRYDEVFNRILKQKLTEYQASLKGSYDNIGDKGKAVLSKSYDNVTLILKDNEN